MAPSSDLEAMRRFTRRLKFRNCALRDPKFSPMSQIRTSSVVDTQHRVLRSGPTRVKDLKNFREILQFRT